jgi:hypothetical protein
MRFGAADGGGALPNGGAKRLDRMMDSRTAESGRIGSVAAKAEAIPSAQWLEMQSGKAWQPAQLRAAILLGGTVRPSVFGTGIRRSMLDLPVSGSQTLLGYWGEEFAGLGAALGLSKMVVRVVIGRNCIAPRKPPSPDGVKLTVERDPMEFRGTGGVLHDLAKGYDDDDLLLMAVATQLCSEPLSVRVQRLWGGGDARVLVGPNQEPTGLVLLRCGCLREIASSGFIDLKEQALPAIAARHSVTVVGASGAAHSIRRWSDYLAALRQRHRPAGAPDPSPYQEHWQPHFGVTEEGSHVDPSAGVHDSVVLSGGRVEAKAMVVRSLVGPGGVVRRGQVVVGRLVTADGLRE